MAKPSIIETLRGHWPTLDRDVAALEADPSYTIRPPTLDRQDRIDRALAVLDKLADERRGTRPITLGPALGEGAMGIVHDGVQEALGRRVAVKSIRPSKRSEQATVHLLQEAWVTGAVEHPNVVPVYDMGVDANGDPQLVLKRVEGTSWAELLDDAAAVEQRFGTAEPLEWHLRTLMQVCTAVHFAHSRDIVHRDIKPENVMIGTYGEVYLADWGIALTLVGDPDGRLPHVEHATTMAGTPGYMAPEMVGTEPTEICIQSDVFLLGAVLFHVVVGHAPHLGANVFEMLAKVVESTPNYPDSMPPELRAICQRAMARSPQDRYADAESFRRALQTWLERRDSIALSTQADAQFSVMEARLEAPEFDRPEVYRVFGECRFGYRSALASWPENPGAIAGLKSAVTLLARSELAAGNPSAASALLGEVLDVPEALRTSIEAALAKAAAERTALEKMRHDLDPTVGRGRRLILAGVMGLGFAVSPLIRALSFTPPTFAGVLASLGISLALAIGLSVLYGEALRRTAFNRRIGETVFATLISLIVFDLGAMQLGLSPTQALTFHILIAAVIAIMVSIAIAPWMVLSAVAYLGAFAVSVAWPPQVLFAMGFANLLMTANALWIWSRPEERRRLRLRPRG